MDYWNRLQFSVLLIILKHNFHVFVYLCCEWLFKKNVHAMYVVFTLNML